MSQDLNERFNEIASHYKCSICGHVMETYSEEPQVCEVCKVTEGRSLSGVRKH